jgi:FlaA1/EpsC-like NDP-sugar epimerase
VIQAGAMAEGGDIFLLDMGEPVRVHDLARAMIQLSGLSVRDDSNPEGDVEIIEIGLRPGEKLHEELLMEESALPTSHPRIVRARESMIDWHHLQRRLDELSEAIADADVEKAMNLLRVMVPSYNGAAEQRQPLQQSVLAYLNQSASAN